MDYQDSSGWWDQFTALLRHIQIEEFSPRFPSFPNGTGIEFLLVDLNLFCQHFLARCPEHTLQIPKDYLLTESRYMFDLEDPDSNIIISSEKFPRLFKLARDRLDRE